MYDPSIGRWLEEDPEGFAARDPNLDRYCDNSPMDETDPFGLSATLEVARGKLKVDSLNTPAKTVRAPLLPDDPKSPMVDTVVVPAAYGIAIWFTRPGIAKDWNTKTRAQQVQTFAVQQWTQIEVTADFESRDPKNKGKTITSLKLLKAGKELGKAHGDHIHLSADPMKPTLQIDNGNTSDEFSEGPITPTTDDKTQKDSPNELVYWDYPNATVGFFRQAEKLIDAEWPDEKDDLSQVTLVQRFVTIVYVEKKAVATVVWTSTFQYGHLPDDKKDLLLNYVPTAKLVLVLPGAINPTEVVTKEQAGDYRAKPGW